MSILWSSSSRRQKKNKHAFFASSPANQLTRYSMQDTSLPSSCTSDRGLMYKNVHGQSIRIYSHIPNTPSTKTTITSSSYAFDRYSFDEDNLNSSSRTAPAAPERSCYLNTNCVLYAMLRAQADGITFDMLFDLFLELFSEDLHEVDWATFENDVKSIHFDGSDEMFKILNDARLKAKIQDFSGSVKKADLAQAWPVLCKYGQLKTAQDREEDADEGQDLIKKFSDQVGLLVHECAEAEIIVKPSEDDDFVVNKSSSAMDKCASGKNVEMDDERVVSSCENNAAHEGSEANSKDMQLTVSPVSSSSSSSSGVKVALLSSKVVEMVSGKRLMLLLVFLMVIYRGLNMLVQQRKIKNPPASKQVLDVMVD
eukprot:TRINITY_DN2564_c0_g1_i1.p1 TRINITY_DN2564_c0_g1~~TRINITY_DN2564_c0_g1_i1.p1  ORF type:complete len:368 (-),score=118.92 TRINITY_DN2564_c0_g1_i1:44-1147(-)